MPSWIVVVIILAALIVAGGVAWMLYEKKRTDRLKRRFGPEYGRTVERVKGRRTAEAELESRAKRVEMFHIRELPEEDRRRFGERWREAQARFVDEPGPAVTEASVLIKEIMAARGYPVADFEQRAADISVQYPTVVENYREGRRIDEANARGEANTEHLRRAMVLYRALFEELLGAPAHEVMEVAQ
jgi:hypothetical protein